MLGVIPKLLINLFLHTLIRRCSVAFNLILTLYDDTEMKKVTDGSEVWGKEASAASHPLLNDYKVTAMKVDRK